MSDWPWVRADRVRFNDCDPMGHANNALYSTFLEESRIQVLGGLEHFILGRVEIDFRSELRPGDEIEVRTRCSRIGAKSLDLEHEIRVGERLAAQAKSVLVAYDYELGGSVELSAELRARLSATPASA